MTVLKYNISSKCPIYYFLITL